MAVPELRGYFYIMAVPSSWLSLPRGCRYLVVAASTESVDTPIKASDVEDRVGAGVVLPVTSHSTPMAPVPPNFVWRRYCTIERFPNHFLYRSGAGVESAGMRVSLEATGLSGATSQSGDVVSTPITVYF